MEERDIKRMTILVPRELYDRFQTCSQDEYKTNTAIVVDWIAKYVREKEREAKKEQMILDVISRFSDIVYSAENLLDIKSPAKDTLIEISEVMLDLSHDGDIIEDPEFIARIVKLERELSKTSSRKKR